MPTLRNLSYSFKDEFWDKEGTSTGGSSSLSLSSVGSKQTKDKKDEVVFVDLPEYLSPSEIMEVVKSAMVNKGLAVNDTQISLEKLKWTMGNLKQPSWLVTALGAGQLAGSILMLTAEDGHTNTASIRTRGEWEQALVTWQNKNRERRQQQQQQPPSPVPPPPLTPKSMWHPPCQPRPASFHRINPPSFQFTKYPV